MTDNNYRKVEGMLYNYRKNKILIKNMKLDLEVLENNYQGVQAIGYEEKAGATNKFNSSVENEVIKREKEIEKLKSKIRLKEIEIEKIDNILEDLEERDRYIIKEYYIKGEQLKNINKHVNLEESYLSTYKNKLVKEIANTMFVQE